MLRDKDKQTSSITKVPIKTKLKPDVSMPATRNIQMPLMGLMDQRHGTTFSHARNSFLSQKSATQALNNAYTVGWQRSQAIQRQRSNEQLEQQ